MNVCNKLWFINIVLSGYTFAVETHKFSLNREYFGRKLTGHAIQTKEGVKLSKCAMECFAETKCVSFNYKQSGQWCELNSADTTSAHPSEFQEESTFLYSDLSIWPEKMADACAKKPCRPGHKCLSKGLQHICMCTDDPAQSCEMVKHMSPEYGDGEYWLYSPLLQSDIKVYCHNMTTAYPKEYITLPAGNNHASVGGADENVPYWQPTYILFTKVGFNIQVTFAEASKGVNMREWVKQIHDYTKLKDNENMTILPGDFTFSDHDVNSAVSIGFGLGSACFASHDSGTGSFNIDTTGTGLIIDPSVTIEAGGSGAYLISSYHSGDGTQLSATCNGHCGSCSPTTPMTLQLNENEGCYYINNCKTINAFAKRVDLDQMAAVEGV